MEQHLHQYSLNALCEGLQVSRSGFYDWRRRQRQAAAHGQINGTTARTASIDAVVYQAFQVHQGHYRFRSYLGSCAEPRQS